MKKMKFILPCILLFLTAQSQTLNPTSSISAPGSADNFRGGYTLAHATSGAPWVGSLISYGGAADNGYDTQISSDYGKNRISFRTRNGDHSYWNPWNEIVTSLGDNYFAGNQNIAGTLSVGVYQSTSPFSVGNNHGVKLSIGNNVWNNTAIIETGYTAETGDFTDLKVASYGYSNGLIRILQNGNVGIGILKPSNKLDVNGTIRSTEVKVTLDGWSDFVFKKDYKLPTLEEVEKHIAEKGHLENIPSEEEVLKNGISLGDMNAKLLQKIEELTLYMIEQQKINKKQSDEIDTLKKENRAIKSMQERISGLENQLNN